MPGDVTFRATVELGGKTATGICVPDDVVQALGGGRRPAVRVTIGGYTYRTTVACKEWVRWIEEAKQPETRARRVRGAVDALQSGKRTR